MKAPAVVFVAIAFADDSVGIMQFVTRGYQSNGTVQFEREPTDANIGAEIMRSAFDEAKLPPKSWRRINAADVPSDRSYRDAWTDDGRAIVHDMPKARAIHLARLRKQRDARLAELDGPWMRATGQRDTAEADRVEAERQELRDLPSRIASALDAAETVDALKQVG